MEKQELAAFVEWLPSNVEEFKDKNPEEVVTMLNELSQTDEGVNVISNLINQFKERTQMFEQGGKLSFLVEKLKNGNKYNRRQARQNKEDAGLYYTDENTGQRLRGPIDKGNLKAKTAKAKAVDGYQDQEFITDFNRKDYRARKQALKQTNPELSRRERKAEALLAHRPGKPDLDFIELPDPIPIPKPKFNAPKTGVVDVGPVEVVGGTYTPRHTVRTDHDIYRTTYNYKPMSWDQFGTYAQKHLNANGAFRNSVDLATMQAYLENEYDRYRREGLDYKWRNPNSNDLLKVGKDWKSRYGAINSDASNWGNVDRSGTIDFTGQKSIGDIVDPEGKIRNAEIFTVDSRPEYNPEERVTNSFTSKTAANTYNANSDMRRSFANSDTFDALLGTAYELAGKPAAAAVLGGIGGRVAGSAVQGFGQNFLNGAYTQAAQSTLSQNMPNNWLTQSRTYNFHRGGVGGVTYNPTGQFGKTSPYMRMLNWQNFFGDNTANGISAYAKTRGATRGGTMKLIQRMAQASPAKFGLAGSVIAGTAQGAQSLYNQLSGNSSMDRYRRENYTPFNPTYTSEE